MEIFGSGGSWGGSCALVPAPVHVPVLRCLLGPGRSFPSWCPGDGCPGDRRWVGSLGIVSGGTTHQYGWMCQFGEGRERFAGNFWEKSPTSQCLQTHLRKPGMRCSKELLGTCFERYEKERWDGVKDCSPAHHWMWLEKLSRLPKVVEGRNDLTCLGWFHAQGRG